MTPVTEDGTHLNGLPTDGGLVGKSRLMRNVRERIARLAASHVSPILLTGPTGSGKDRAARHYHLSTGSRGPFVPVNTAALAPDLLVSAMFGHVRGGFTGAVGDRMGFVEAARGGAVFLDEIGVASPQFQTLLLRLVENREYYRVGSSTVSRFEGCLVLATNRDLRAEVVGGRFLPDLLWRLDREVISLPPLADRPEDIPVLVRHFLHDVPSSAVADLGIPVDRHGRWKITSRAMSVLQQHAWPGNVRELLQVLGRVTRAVAPGATHIGSAVVRAELRPASRNGGTTQTLAGHTAAYALDVLERSGGNLSVAAQALGISRARLRRILGR